MKYIGLAFAIVSLFVFVRFYIRSLRRRRLCYGEISRLINHIGERLKTQRAPLLGLCADLHCGELKECGFFALAIEDGKSLEGVECLLMDKDDKERLAEFLCDFGSGYLDTELKRTALMAEHFSRRSEAEDKECSDKTRLTLLLFCSFAVALALLCV